jgi:hypothetical protein
MAKMEQMSAMNHSASDDHAACSDRDKGRLEKTAAPQKVA